MSKRNDPHSPVNLVTENYEFVDAFDTQAPGWLVNNDYAMEICNKVRATNRDRGMNQCHHCGAHIRYVAVMAYLPTGDYIAIGEDCLANRFDRATHVFQALRKAAQLDREKQRIRTAVAEFVAVNPDLAFMGAKKFEDRQEVMPQASRTNNFIHDVARKLNQYGSLSEKQVTAVRNSIVKDQTYADRKAAEALAPAEVLVPVVEGKQQITGEVLSTKWQDSDYGSTLKMLVKDDRGFKVWGSVPASLNTSNYNPETGDDTSVRAERGDRVAFSASVEKSGTDESFGFFKRPTKGVIITKAAAK